MRKQLVISLMLLVAPLSAMTQQDPTVDAGLKAFGSYQGSDIDTVNLENGNLMLHIPIISYPQRGGALNFSVSTHYNNVNWTVLKVTNPLTGKVTQSWKLSSMGVGVVLDQATKITNFLDNNQLSGLDAISLTTADGGTHILENADPYVSGGSMPDWRAIDGSGYYYHQAASQTDTTYGVDATGIKTIWTSAVSVTLQDPNGNQIVQSTNGTWTDTLGRVFPATLYSKYYPGYFSTVSTTNYTGCAAGTVSSAALLSLPGYSGGTYQLKLCNQSYTFSSNMNVPGTTDTTTTGEAVHSIVLPNGTVWIFDYDGQGNISKVTYPTGGTISYTWTTIPGGSIQIASRIVSDGVTPGTWKYSGGTVTDPQGNDTVHSFEAACNNPNGEYNDSDSVESETDYYAGTGSGRTLLRKITRTFSSNPDAWMGLPGPSFPGCMNTVMTGTTTTFVDTGETSQTTISYDNAGGASLYYWLTTSYNGSWDIAYPLTFGLPVSKTTSSFGSGAPGPLVRQSTTSYLWQTNSNYLTANLLSRVSTSKILDGSGNLCAETDFLYDGSTPVSSGITTGHVSVSGVRGNVSSTNRQFTTTPCQSGATWTPVSTTVSVYDTGVPYQVTDPGVHTTTYSYASTYQGAYLTGTQLPSTSNSSGTFTHSTSAGYDFNTGLVTSYVDQNGKTSSYSYDIVERMLTAVTPDTDASGNHGETDYYYPDAVTIERKQRLHDSVWTDEYELLDGLGRHGRTMSNNGQSGNAWNQQDTCYDNMGRATFKSYPYQSTGLGTTKVCAGTGDTFVYDALSRQTSVTHSDGTSATNSYTGAATDSKSEGNGSKIVERVTQVDSMGRLAYACEVSSTTLSGSSGTPSSCGLDIARTGFLTSYSYDGLGNLKNASQPGLAARSFTYDSFNRLTSAYNPESGTTTYNWNNDGELISRIRPAPNVPGTTSTVTTTYSYDTLHRSTSQTYSDGTTPASNFVFDGGTWLGQAVTSGIGHTVYAYTGSSATSPRTGEVSYQFDAMGRAQTTKECLPSTCAGTLYEQDYQYNLAGGTTSATDGVGHTMTWTYSAGDSVTAVQASFSTPALISGIVYGPYGLTGATLGNGHTESDVYDTRGRLQSIAYTNSASATVYSAGMTRAADSSLTSSTDTVNGSWSYTYDEFNRLKSATASSGTFSGLALAWSYDRYGNRLTQSASGTYGGTVYQGTFSFSSNQITGYCYDAAGNLLDMQSCAAAGSNHLYTYDAEGRLIATSGFKYEYNAAGQRVSKDNSSGVPQSLYLHDGSGNQVAELNASLVVQHVNVYSGSHLIGTLNPTTGKVYYAYSDWLGTKRYEADNTGTYTNSWAGLPFGDNQTALATGLAPTEHHFTGKEHDSESGLDYFDARYYQSQTGRWMLPDWSAVPVPVPYAVFSNPQSLNLYTYVGNNPVNAIDGDGHSAQPNGNSVTGSNPFFGFGNANCDYISMGPCVVDDGALPSAAEEQFAAYQLQVSAAEQAQQQSTALGNGTGTAGAAGTPASARQGTPTTYSNPTWIKSGACPNGCWFAGQIIPYTLVNSAGKPVKVTGNIAENIEIIASANSDDRTGGAHMQNQSGFVDNVGLILGYNRIAGPDNPGYSYLKTSQTFTFTPDGGGPISLTTKITQMIISTSSGSIRVGTQVVVP